MLFETTDKTVENYLNDNYSFRSAIWRYQFLCKILRSPIWEFYCHCAFVLITGWTV